MVLSFNDLPTLPGAAPSSPPPLPPTYHGLHISAAGNGTLALVNAASTYAGNNATYAYALTSAGNAVAASATGVTFAAATDFVVLAFSLAGSPVANHSETVVISGASNGTTVPGCGFGAVTLGGRAPARPFWYQTWNSFCTVDTFGVALADAATFGAATAITLDDIVVCPASANSTVTRAA